MIPNMVISNAALGNSRHCLTVRFSTQRMTGTYHEDVLWPDRCFGEARALEDVQATET